jgi:hypothetical protein
LRSRIRSCTISNLEVRRFGMEATIRRYAQVSIARGCGFGALAITTMMVGSASDLSLFFRSGGIGALLMCFILLLKASRVEHTPVKDTEVWVMIPRDIRPSPEIAAPLIARARRDYMMKFAYVAAVVAGVEFAADLVLMIARAA